MIEGKKIYLTQEGLERLKNEARNLGEFKLLKTKNEVPKILQSEDLNPEYLSFQEDLSLLEARLADLGYIIKNAEVIKMPPKEKQNIISLGATVVVEVDGQEDEFEIVGSLEANPSIGRISNESPVGKALLGHEVREEIVISSPVKTVYKIKDIKYHVA
ncbi:MAG: hypothetical protein COT34_02445 [Candidatus Nealsonbacteria bacterium CG08_land_8_20_14_0_20_43_11]|uniref:Transcription elongation factor GreA n=1 Tax=Candidatus Nealsonbacteria bacterium CG08_land_8_20_14_0_20_43_11 TaxID=1974706 RepID=A0A2M6T0P5_9BACT|nr:MAG: hypothetical protein COT34_02445 [Candidatus Nealsonbacteria bacterium CG08_land_8_20_14_0_20_43_11]